MPRDLPPGWQYVRLGQVARELRHRNTQLRVLPDKLVGVFKDEGMTATRDRVRGASVERCKIVPPGAFAYNPMRLNIGSIARLLKKEEAIVSPDYVVFETDPDQIDSSFLDYLRSSEIWRRFVNRAGDGGVRVRIYFDDLAELRFPLPTITEQQKIVAILSSVDEAIRATQAAIEQTRKVRQAVLQRLLTTGIGHIRFKQTEIGDLPDGWQVKPLGAVCSKVSVGIASSATHAYRDHGVPLLRNQNIIAGHLDLSDLLFVSAEYDRVNSSKRVKSGDIVTMRTGYPGRSAVIPDELDGCQTFTTLIIRPQSDTLDPEFFCTWINSDYGMHQVVKRQAGGAQQNLNAGVLKKMPVPLPPLQEQKRIVLIAKSFEQADKKRLSQLRDIKAGLLADLLTGRVRVEAYLPIAAE